MKGKVHETIYVYPFPDEQFGIARKSDEGNIFSSRFCYSNRRMDRVSRAINHISENETVHVTLSLSPHAGQLIHIWKRGIA